MKTIILLIILALSVAEAQEKTLFFETGASFGMEGYSVSGTIQYADYKNFIAGGGLTLIGISSFNSFSDPEGTNSNEVFSWWELQRIEKKGPFGIGAGARIIFGSGLAIEGGYIRYTSSEWQIYKSTVTGLVFKRELQGNDKKGTFYGRILIVSPENNYTIGFGRNGIDEANLYLGYKF